MSDTARPVVVGVDGSDAAMDAAKWAAAVAEDGEHATAILKSTEEEVRAAFGGLDVFTLRSDEPLDEWLSTRSRTAQLVVLGSDEVSPAAALLIGSTTLAVTAHSACPVIAWRGGNAVPFDQPIVLGVDGDRTGAAAFKAAFEFADRFGVGLNAVHAWSAFRPPVDAITPHGVDWDASRPLQWPGLLNVLEPWTELSPDVAVTYFVEPEGASKALIRHAADSQLVVVGSRGRNLVTGALLGSTSLNLLHHSPVPVMLCHRRSDTQ